MATQTTLTVDQYLRLPEQEGVIRELDEGRVIDVSPTNFKHAILVARIAHLLLRHIEGTGSRYWVAEGSGFGLGPATVRIPDVFVLRKKSAATMEGAASGVLQGAPELAVEVVSPGEKAAALERKIHQYLAAGTPSVWVLYAESKHVMVYRANGACHEFHPGDQLTDPDVLPGLALEIDEIFSEL
jgi:Uma2 family endonuclease